MNKLLICDRPEIIEEFKTSEQLAEEYLERKAGRKVMLAGYVWGSLFIAVIAFAVCYPWISRLMR